MLVSVHFHWLTVLNNTVLKSETAKFHNQESNNSLSASIILRSHSLGIRLRILIPIVVSPQAWTALSLIYYTRKLLINTWWFSVHPSCVLLYVITSFLVWQNAEYCTPWWMYIQMRAHKHTHTHTHSVNGKLILVTNWLLAVLINSKEIK
jgi:hypothetical protein